MSAGRFCVSVAAKRCLRVTHLRLVGMMILWALASCGEPKAVYDVHTASMGDIRDVVPASGMVEPLRQVGVRAERPGQVVEILVAPNSTVVAGQILARLKPDRALLTVEGARADLAAAQANVRQADSRLEQARRQLSNRSILAEKGFVSGGAVAEFEAAETEAKAASERARAEVRSANARARSASVDMADILLRAPQAGVVLSEDIEVGEAVGPTSEEPLFVIVSDLDRLRLRALVAEPDIGRVVKGMIVNFSVEAYPGRTFTGRVVDILKSPIRERTFVSYPVVVDVDANEGNLFPGMTATVEFIHTDVRNVLSVPVAALYFTPEDYVPVLPEPIMRRLRRAGLDKEPEALLGAEVGALYARGKRRLFVLTPNGPTAREVRVGAETDALVEVAEGLAIGESVIIGDVGSETEAARK